MSVSLPQLQCARTANAWRRKVLVVLVLPPFSAIAALTSEKRKTNPGCNISMQETALRRSGTTWLAPKAETAIVRHRADTAQPRVLVECPTSVPDERHPVRPTARPRAAVGS